MKLAGLSLALYLSCLRSANARPTDHMQQIYSASNDVASSQEHALSSSGLYGWTGCSINDRSRILKAIDDSREILESHTVQDFANWRETPAAIELFGQAVANDYHGWSSKVQQNFRNARDFVRGSSGEEIQIFCHDLSMKGPLRDECSSARQPDPIVVARNHLGRQGPALMFCDAWFRTQSLSSAMESRLTPTADLDSTENQARVLITALMLIPSIAPWPQDHYGPSMIYRKQQLPGDDVQRYVTSAAACRKLAAIQDSNFRRTISNADTYSWYALDSYLRNSERRR